jgi:hypothetical protein
VEHEACKLRSCAPSFHVQKLSEEDTSSSFEHQQRVQSFEKESPKSDVFWGASTYIKARSVVTKVGSFIPKCHYHPSSHPSTTIEY